MSTSDELTRWIKFWNITDARDKINKFLQYSCKGLAWTIADLDNTTCFKLLSLSRTYDLSRRDLRSHLFSLESCADSRKIFRLGKFLNEYVKIRELLLTTNSVDDTLAHLLNLGTRASYFAYWVFDAFFILSKIKIFRGNTKTIQDKSFLFWFLAIIFNLLLDFHILRLIVQREQQLKAQEVRGEELERLYVKRRTCYLNIIKNCGDLITASNGIRVPHRVIGRGFSDGLVGLGGSVSALIACYQQYPQRSNK